MLITIIQTLIAVTGALWDKHFDVASIDEVAAPCLEDLPKELIEFITTYLEPRDLRSLSVTSKELDSKLFNRKFEHIDLYACKSEQKLQDIENITSHDQICPTVRRVTIRIDWFTENGWQPPKCRDQMPQYLPLLQQAKNLTCLSVDNGVADTLLHPITLLNLKKLLLFHVCMDIGTLIVFIQAQPKLEDVKVDGAYFEDPELPNIYQSFLDDENPAIEEVTKERASVLIRKRTHVRNVVVDERSDSIHGPS